MIKYYCETCKIDTECSICPICAGRTKIESKVYFCSHCNIPLYDEFCSLCGEKAEYMTTDVRPVFPEERLLLEILLNKPFEFLNSSVWNGIGNRYFVDGKKITLKINNLILRDSTKIKEMYEKLKVDNSYEYFNNNIQKFVKANLHRFQYITTEAVGFIKDSVKNYDSSDIFVSFSGGKDSTVTSSLVTSALSNPSVIHIFGDTTLEFEETIQYVTRFREANRKTPLLTAINKEKSFEDLCREVGPPSRVMRWCCTIFKTGAITRKINQMFKNKTNILTFYGVRRSESTSRSKYEREADSPKITKQKVISPIIDWFDFDIWLYILTTGIDFNVAYRLGYSRVGCWCCPNNSEWSEFLSSVHMSEKSTNFRNLLIEFATKIGKPDPEDYIDEGGWKARQGGNGIEYSKNTVVSFQPCAVEENTLNFDMLKPITEQLYELFKPFGYLNFELGNKRLGEVFISNIKGDMLLKLQGRIGSNKLKVTILKLPLARAKNMKEAEQKIRAQITKYQLCMGCLACESVCKYNAIELKQLDEGSYIYNIDDKKCVRCSECISHFDGGCYMRKTLRTKRGN